MRIRSGIAAALTAICASIAPAPWAPAAEPDFGRSDSVVSEATRLCLGSDTDGKVHTVECRWNSPYRQGVPEAMTAWGTIGVLNVQTDGCRLQDFETSVHTTSCLPTQYGATEWLRGIGYSRKAWTDAGTTPRIRCHGQGVSTAGHRGLPVPGQSVPPQLSHLSPSPRTTDVPARPHVCKGYRSMRPWAPRSSWQAWQSACPRLIGSERVPSTVLGGDAGDHALGPGRAVPCATGVRAPG